MRALRHLPAPAPAPWSRPRAELLLLVLVALAALSSVHRPITQDVSRLCLSRALVAGRLSNDACLAGNTDRAQYGGHLYSDKAPGMSVLEIPPAEAVGLPPPADWALEGDLRLWAVRVFASGIPFLLCVFLVGRLSEGLAPGLGAPAMVTFALGTLMAPLAAAGFDHVPAACLGFLAFVLAWRRRPLAAGLAAGAALTTEYEAAAVLLIVAAYTALQGARAVLRFTIGALPGAALLAAYDWAAFGAPWHTAPRYADNLYTQQERSGLLGVHLPTLHAVRLVFVGDRGLLLTSPVVVAAAAGLVLLWRRGLRAEALACGLVTAVFAVAECGYFLPYGGGSPGPRFLVPALPFLALGLGPAFARWRLPATVLAGVSIVATTALTLTWALTDSYRNTVWGEIVRALRQGGSSPLAKALAKNVLLWDLNRIAAAALVVLLAAAAFAVAMWRRPVGTAG